MRRALTFITLRQWRQHRLRLLQTLLGSRSALRSSSRCARQSTLIAACARPSNNWEEKQPCKLWVARPAFHRKLKTVRATWVQAAEPVTETIARSTLPGADTLVLGLDIGATWGFTRGLFDDKGLVVNNPLAFTTRADSIAISESLRTRYGLKEGDTLSLDSATEPKVYRARILHHAGNRLDLWRQRRRDGYLCSPGGFQSRCEIRPHRYRHGPERPVDGCSEIYDFVCPRRDVVRPDLRGQVSRTPLPPSVWAGDYQPAGATIGVFIIFNSLHQRESALEGNRHSAFVGVTRRGVQQMFLIEAAVMG